MASAEWADRILAKLAVLDVLPAVEAAGRNEDEHQRNIRDYYGLSLNPKATHAEVEEFERRHGVRLPSDYRTFVTEIGNGGCGPGNCFEGLYPFQHSAGPDWPGDSLCRPFPPAEPPEGLDRWPPVPVSEETRKHYRNGLLLLSHYGCGILACLVVCGARYGEVWIDDFANGGLILPAQDSWVVSPPASGGGPSFAEWYEGWLDQQLERWGGAEPSASADRPRDGGPPSSTAPPA
jgi:hypothetical protein